MPNTYLGSTTPMNVRGKMAFFLPQIWGKPLSRAQTRLIQANYGFVTGNIRILALNQTGKTTEQEPSLSVGGTRL